MNDRKFTLLAVGLAILYWFAESVIHRFIYSERIFEVLPSEVNELWMRLLIVLLIVAFGGFADNRARKIQITQREKREVFYATVRSTQHILNNLLNQLQLVILDLDDRHALEDETRRHLERSILEGKQQVERLSSVTDISSKSIEQSVMPKHDR